MTSLKRRFAVRALVVAVHGALAALALTPAMAAAEDDLYWLTHPTSVVEVGALYVSRDSAKFGEFNGLDQKGVYGIGNFGLFGGNGDSGSYRWKLVGNNLGLDTRSVRAEVGNQGRWRVTGGYDEIPHHNPWSDSYETIFDGAGSTSLTLPADYPPASARRNAGALSNWNNIQTPNAGATTTGGGPAYVIPAELHRFDIATKRKIGDVSVSTILAPGWEFSASAKRIQKDGSKLTGVNFGGFSGGNMVVLVPEPIDSTTDAFSASIAYADRKMNFNVGYSGSFYRNDVKLWTVQNPFNNNAVINNVARLQSYPDNDMHQFNVGGGYRFTSTTRLQVTGSWSRLTQNDSFIDPPTGSNWVLGDTSAHAKVNNSFVYARLTTRPLPALSVNASYRYDDRDNKTPVIDILATSSDANGTPTLRVNEPLSRRVQTAALEAEYKLGAGQALNAEYQRQDIRRTANAEDGSPFRAEKTYEDTVKLEYRKAVNDSLTGRLSYAYSNRTRSDYEENVGIAPGADAGLVPGFEHFYLAKRKRDRVRSQVSYQATEAVAVQATLDLNRDKYDLDYGLKQARGWMFSLDGSARASDQLAFEAYYSYEDMRHDLDAFAIPRGTALTLPHAPDGSCASYPLTGGLPVDIFTDPCRNWAQREADKTHTVGVSAKYTGLLGGRMNLMADLSYSNARTPIDMSGGTYYSNGAQNVYVPAESFPEIKTELTQLRLTGNYALNKQSAVQVLYIYGHLKSNDWAYDAFTNSPLGVLAVTNVVGAGMTSPNYDVNVIGVSYIYRFR